MAESIGCQQPSFEHVPAHVGSEGPDACELARAYGLAPDTWQRHVLDAWMGTGPDLRWSSSDCACALPRQNGKNAVLEVLELYQTAILGMKVLHTAHEVKTCRKHFLRMKDFFDDSRQYPELSRLVRYIRNTNGQEAIVLKNGGSIEFIARSNRSGRGFTVDTLVFDEAQELTDEQIEAIQPAISSAPSGNPQTIYTGTPTPPTSPGTVFTRLRAKAHQDEPPANLCWIEWAADEIGDVHDQSRWYRYNPSLGIRLLPTVVASEVEKMTPDGFARERLGWWNPIDTSASAIDPEQWEECTVAEPDAEGRVSFGLDMPPDRSALAVGVAVRHGNDTAYIGLQEYRDVKSQGVAWAVEWLTERWPKTCAVVVDAQSPAMSIVPDLVKRHVKVTVTQTRDLGAATGRMLDMIHAGTLQHLDTQHQPQLNAAVNGATLRPLGPNGASAWNKKGSDVDISPLQACTLALHGVYTSRRHPGRKAKAVAL